MTAATSRRRAAAAPPPSVGRRATDLGVLGLLFVLALVGFQTAYGGVQFAITGVMALVLGMLIALLTAHLRWGPLRTLPIVLGVYFLLGPMLAAPTRALWGILPTPGPLWELLKAPVTTWKSALTVAPPVGSAQGVLVVVWLSVLLLSLASATIVLRTRRYVIAWLFPLALLMVTIVFGTTDAVQPVVRGVLFAVVSVAWLTWRFESARLDNAQSTIISDSVRPGSWKNPVLRRRLIGGGVIMAIAVGAAFGASSLLDPPEGAGRFALRDRISPPFDPDLYVSPLSEFRGYRKDQRDAVLFTVTGVEAGDYVRLATMDQYDLHVYNVAGNRDRTSTSGAFMRTASGVDLHEPGEQQRTATVTIGDYRGVWLPTLGERTDRIDLSSLPQERAGVTAENLFLNEKSQTAVNAAGVAEGDVYEFLYDPYTEPAAEQLESARFADIAMPENSRVDQLAVVAEEWAGDSDSDYERFANLSRALKYEAFYSNGLAEDTASLSGHGVSRLLAMMDPIGFDKEQPDAQPTGKIGDEEQYAALLAVMARSLDMPARVVMGFEVPEGQEGTVSITGDNVTAWVEVAFDGVGWVRFDPAPDEDQDPTQPEPKEVEKPLPQVAQPPPPPAEPPSPPPGAMSEESETEDPPDEPTRSWVVYLGIGAIPIVLALLAALAIVVAKSVRRGRRRTRGDLATRVDGGWQEILDQLTDLGRAPDRLSTRVEIAARLDGEVPALGATQLASRADRAVFGPDDLPVQAADEYWAQVQQARRGLAASVPWHRRLRGALSLRSFRRRAAERRAQRRLDRANRRARAKADRRAASLRQRRSSLRGASPRTATRSRKGNP
ncbi:transglutaminase domain-containing protein [Brachybacterium sp. J144]|uniref:transglutaminase-like domain-containing protein n=1 Tax=Brachybacterium sp. J144 TaxID=3116487 RepID=UPI002E776893|nr:transglutaminase domain-containing protein [Brachybacterium sp. J144]MEE1649510.1 transglutaminase domain-containing protein [Brachybacterium sp. J144]